MIRRWWPLICAPLACLNPLAPTSPEIAPVGTVEAQRVPCNIVRNERGIHGSDCDDGLLTLATYDDHRYLLHWNGKPVTCTTPVTSLFPVQPLQARDGWYGVQLRAAGERSLCDDPEAAEEVYRLSWIPSFHPTVIIRFERRDQTYRLRGVILSGAGGYEPGIVANSVDTPLTQADWQAWLGLAARARFWTAPTEASDTVLDTSGAVQFVMGLDGAQWLLEARQNGQYHAVDRWSPDPDGPHSAFRTACTWLLHRSGLVPDSLLAGY